MERGSKSGLLNAFQRTLDTRQSHSARRQLTVSPSTSADFSSNDFLSLAKSTDLRQAYDLESARQSTLPLGSGGSRLLDGNSLYAENLEKEIAAFHNAPSGLLFNSGFDANTGVFACIPQPGDVVLYDEHIHASVHEGMRLSRARLTKAFAHNSPSDLKHTLLGLLNEDSALRNGTRNVFVAVETVYSMDGDVAPIVEILDMLDTLLPHGNSHLVVDEAHSTGVYGPRGRGLVCALGVEDRCLARLHTFGKALSANGAILLCPPVMRDYLINYARSLIYTTAMSLPALVLIRAVYSLLIAGHTLARQRHLWDLTTQKAASDTATDGPQVAHLLPIDAAPAQPRPALPECRLRRSTHRAADGAGGRPARARVFARWQHAARG
ncbi:hypothetical protein FH972_023791 [Carpinus fangiana]|uniref:Aminotransferase class I/classII large domain-containing protein n=1 Tax=Carpinus fangiana TaxID=176857 RepID=A0A5N6KWG1_9ROSI|nr:hypothetical protein FH972_023791 [Carpinus fangiana]